MQREITRKSSLIWLLHNKTFIKTGRTHGPLGSRCALRGEASRKSSLTRFSHNRTSTKTGQTKRLPCKRTQTTDISKYTVSPKTFRLKCHLMSPKRTRKRTCSARLCCSQQQFKGDDAATSLLVVTAVNEERRRNVCAASTSNYGGATPQRLSCLQQQLTRSDATILRRDAPTGAGAA